MIKKSSFTRLYALLLVFSFAFMLPQQQQASSLLVGVAKTDITPPIGTPSAGYAKRNGEGMEGILDPLLAIAMVIVNEEKTIAFCSVDHLGFTYEMVQAITHKVHLHPKLKNCEVYIGSSHTHSGGGAYLDIPIIGETLAGKFDPLIKDFYIEQTAEAIIKASQNLQPAYIGIGYGQVDGIAASRSLWPKDLVPSKETTVIKVTTHDGKPIAVLFNYPLHPTVLDHTNKRFSSDFVGVARKSLKQLLGEEIEPIFFNGAQAEIIPNLPNGGERYDDREIIGETLAQSIAKTWHSIQVQDDMDIETYKDSYFFVPQPTPFGLKLPMKQYASEVNLIIFDKQHAFVTIPGELSSLYQALFKIEGDYLGLAHVSILGLVNDAHGYIILPEAWRQLTYESNLSFGGANYGATVAHKVTNLFYAWAGQSTYSIIK